MPSGLAFDAGGHLYAADPAAGSVVSVSPDGSTSAVVSDFEGTPLVGPTALSFNARGDLFFADGGALGETSLESPMGSVFVLSSDAPSASIADGDAPSLVLRPLLTGCLAAPSALAISARDGSVFVAEMLRNRVLRLVRHPPRSGSFIASVFVQFAGRVGPSALAVAPDGTVYVARGEPAGEAIKKEGVISVVAPDGLHVEDILIPDGSEITGLALTPSADALIVTEASTGGVYAVQLPVTRDEE
jgi:sugar lactone lactonase YvrE